MQWFTPKANSLLRIALTGVGLFVIVSLGVAAQYYSSTYYTQVGVVLEQPVPFSHKHHVGELGLDCRYCHSSVERSSFAGVPGASTCMHCHSQIWPEAKMLEPVRVAYSTNAPLAWNRVHSLPDYVYFNHSIHVAKGIGCASCHGRVDQMPLMQKRASLQMLWCINCHRNPEKEIRPKSEVFSPHWKAPASYSQVRRELVEKYNVSRKTDCYTCHR